MIRLCEEQMAVLSCYSGNRNDVIVELRKAIPFIEDAELREMSENLLKLLLKMQDEEFSKVFQNFDGKLETESVE